MAAAEREIHDHRLIRRDVGPAPFPPADVLAEHRLSRTWLADKGPEENKCSAPHPSPAESTLIGIITVVMAR